MRLTGIIDAHHFRNQILAAREALKQRHQPAPQPLELTALQGVERRLDEIIGLLKAKN
jgi:hypothetical protein